MKTTKRYFGYLLIELSLTMIVFFTASISLAKLMNQSVFTVKKLEEINEKALISKEIIFLIDRFIKEGRLSELQNIIDTEIEFNNNNYKYNINYTLDEKLNSLYKFHIEINKANKWVYSSDITRFIPYEKK